jgi:predicted ester cyclase
MAMTPTEIKAAGAQLLETAMNQGNVDALDLFMAPTFVDHSPYPGAEPTREGMKGSITRFRAALPDLHYTIDAEIVEGDQLVHLITGHGTMTGPLMGIPPTGRSATWQEVHIVRLADGQVVESWSVVDQLGMLIQLGVVPAPGGAPAPA